MSVTTRSVGSAMSRVDGRVKVTGEARYAFEQPIEELARGVLKILDARGVERVSFCGLSLGGAVGMWLARGRLAHQPHKAASGG